MDKRSIVIGALFLLCAGAPVFADDASTIIAGVFVEQECDANSPAFQSVRANPDITTQMHFEDCVVIDSPAPISTKRFVIAPSGNLNFQFYLLLTESNRTAGPFDGPKLSARFTVTVTARGPNGEVATNSGTATLFGSGAAGVPPGAAQATPGGSALVKLNIPLFVDWAESSVTFTVDTSQALGSADPVSETCTTPSERRVGQMCSIPDWVNQASGLTGLDLSKINAGLTLPGAISPNEFALFVTPAANFQLPVVPVAILYAPLGNGAQASASLTISTITGTNAQIGNTSKVTTTVVNDDKSHYEGGVTIGVMEKAQAGSDISSGGGSLGFTAFGEWDASAETNWMNSTGTTGQIVNSSQISQQFSLGPTTTLPLTQVSFFTQPFWSDIIITALNAQFSIWDYPGGPLIQPLGSTITIPIALSQLVACASSTGAVQTDKPNSTNQAHFLVFAVPDDDMSHFIWLSSQQCAELASLDQFLVQGSQSSAPLAWRQLPGGSSLTSSPQTIKSNQSTQLTAGQNSTSTYSVKLNGVQTNNLAVAAKLSATLFDALSVDGSLSGSWTSSEALAHTTEVTFTADDASSLQSETDASTTIADSSGISVPVNVKQDAIFQGIAVQDTDMHFVNPKRGGPVKCCRGHRPKVSRLPLALMHVASGAQADSAFLIDNPYANILVQSPADRAPIERKLRKLQSEAIGRHISRPVPSPPAASASNLSAPAIAQELLALKGLGPKTMRDLQRLPANPQ